MSQSPHEPENLLESLLSDSRQPDDQAASAAPVPEDEDVDGLIDMLEALVAEGRRVPFGRKLMIDEDRLLDLVDIPIDAPGKLVPRGASVVLGVRAP